MDAAKWYDPDKTDDTNHIGTRDYAAPEQAGFGFTASYAMCHQCGDNMYMR